MGRSTNSNILRLGTTKQWKFLTSSSELLLPLSQYLDYFLEDHFNRLASNSIIGFGSISGKYYRGFFSLTVNLYNLTDKKVTFSPFFQLYSVFLISFYRSFCGDFLTKLPYPVKLFFIFKPLEDLEPDFVINYFKLRVSQGVSVMDVIAALHKLLWNVHTLSGYKIEVTGRYARQERASKLSIKKGQVSLAQHSTCLEFKQDFVLLKHGKCGLKIWINKKKGFIPNSLLYQLT